MSELDHWLGRRMRMCYWKQWRYCRTKVRNLRKLGTPLRTAGCNTHSRCLDRYLHVHVVMPAGAIDRSKRLWRTKKSKDKPYLFDYKALTKVFRAKMLEAITQEGFALPATYPRKWIAHCKHVGSGEKALVYPGRYLYRGVIQEKNIIVCEDGEVTFRYINSKTGHYRSHLAKRPAG